MRREEVVTAASTSAPRSGGYGARIPGFEAAMRCGLFGKTLHAHGGGFRAAQRKRRSADAHGHRVAAEPHAGNYIAAGTRHEAQVAQPAKQQVRVRRFHAQCSGRFQSRYDRGIAATQGRQWNYSGAVQRFGGFHEMQYGVAWPRM
jgi:hypothetical protein